MRARRLVRSWRRGASVDFANGGRIVRVPVRVLAVAVRFAMPTEETAGHGTQLSQAAAAAVRILLGLLAMRLST